MVSKFVDVSAKVLAGLGALNVGLGALQFNLLSWVPVGAIMTIVILLVGISGAYVLWEVYNKRI